MEKNPTKKKCSVQISKSCYNITGKNMANGNRTICQSCSNKKSYKYEKRTIQQSRLFSSNPRAICWSDKNLPITPNTVLQSSKEIFVFNCDACSHEFSSRLIDVKNGIWCPYCNNKELCNDEKCSICEEKSCASQPKLVESWSSDNSLLLDNVS